MNSNTDVHLGDLVDPKTRSYGWCFTINNYTEKDEAELVALVPEATYLVYSYEVGSQTETPHIQGYVHFANDKTRLRVSKFLRRAWLKKADGLAEANRTYVIGPWDGIDYKTKLPKHKDYNPNFKESGVMPQQGKRTDIDRVRDVVKETNSMRAVVNMASSFQSVRLAECWLKYHEKRRTTKPLVKWYYGATGTGKTETAKRECPPDKTYYAMRRGKWYEGYDAHEYMIVNDVRSKFMSFDGLLTFLDHEPYTLECKGGSRQFLAHTIIFTSPFSPQELYSDVNEDLDQLLDRIDVIKHFTGESWRKSKSPNITITVVKDVV